MITNYLKSAWRHLRKNRLFSLINILGLAIGLATFFTIALYVHDELSYDRFNIQADNMARVVFQANVNGGKINESVTMAPVAQTMKNDFPEVLDATRILDHGRPKVTVGEARFKGDRFAIADPNFFSIFTLPMIAGDASTALLRPNSVVITRSLAEKYFGGGQALGKVLYINENKDLYEVTGVIEDIPANSHFHFDLFGSTAGYADAKSNSWMSGGFHTYLLLKPGTDLKKMETRFPDMVAQYMGPQIQEKMGLSLEQFRTKGNHLGFALQALKDIHLNSYTTNEFEPGGNASYVYIFGGIAVFMLIVASINFINLSTAGASKRAKEVGVRKAIGSDRAQLFRQFLSESLLVTLLALLVAFVMLQLTLPAFNNISGKQLRLGLVAVPVLTGLGLIVGFLAAVYPALYLSSFKPVAVLKGKIPSTGRGSTLRSGLVVFQFFVSVALIIGTLVVYQQMKFIQNKDIGYDKSQLVTIPNSYLLGKNEETFRQQMLRDPRVISATMSWYKPAGPSNYNNALAYAEGADHTIVNGVDYLVDEQYIPTMGMKVIDGRNFSAKMKTDSSAIILNETAATTMGWTSGTAIGKTVFVQNTPNGDDFFAYHVIGVVKNFHFKSLHEAVSPLFMTYYPQGGLIFKIRPTGTAEVLATLKKHWDNYQTEEPFTYAFMDELFMKTYSAEQKTATVLNIFSVLTIFVACLGLFGLATYMAEQRTREIGIRKVLGATVSQVTRMLSAAFLKLVVIATLIAFPVAWWGAGKWLGRFAYRIEIDWRVFVAAGVIAAAIALLTVSWQAIRAAVANPVESLRNE